jgi:hypothetical protein
MAKAKKQSSRGRKQDRAQDQEVGRCGEKAVKKVGTSRKRVERRFGWERELRVVEATHRIASPGWEPQPKKRHWHRW